MGDETRGARSNAVGVVGLAMFTTENTGGPLGSTGGDAARSDDQAAEIVSEADLEIQPGE
jgi:hypothetical protein